MSTVTNFLRRVWTWVRTHKKSTAAIVVVLLIGGLVKSASAPKQPTYVTAVAERGDLQQTVEAVGTVVSERDLELQFPVTDVVSKVYVKEGDRVKTGQILVALRAGSLSASVASASANVQSAQAALQALEEGSRPEDVAVYEAQVANKRAALEVAKQTLKSAEDNLIISQQKLTNAKLQAQISLSGEIATAQSTISQQISVAKTALTTITTTFAGNDVQDAIIKSNNSGYEFMKQMRDTAEIAVTAQQNAVFTNDYQQALKSMENARAAVSQASTVVDRAYDVMNSLNTNSYLSNSAKETYLSTLASHRTSIQAALAKLDGSIKSLRDASAGYNTSITSEEGTMTSLQGTRDRAKADIMTYETSLKIDEAQLALKKAPARETDLNSARARVRQAQADLARSAAQYNDTVLRAPVDGVITKMNVKAGEMRPSTEASVTMLGNTPYRIEMYVSEIDVPKVQSTQSGTIELDAFRGTDFSLHVSEIDSGPTDRDGVSKYRVKLDFTYPHDELKIGMTGDARIITGERRDVISVPQRSVIENDDGTSVVRILLPDGKTIEQRKVTTGMEAEGGNVEVTGVEEGETVIVLVKA